MSSIDQLPVAYAVNHIQYATFTTQELRDQFLLTNLKTSNQFNLTYTMYDRLVAGTVVPVNESLVLPNYDILRSAFFLERRELGIINVGGNGFITVDGNRFSLSKYDCVYATKGSKEVIFESTHSDNPAIFYLLSSPAHTAYSTVLMKGNEASPVTLGSSDTCNERTIYKYIHLEGIQSCQLVMGLTVLAKGSVWNTMPSHVHNRRSEVYFYFDVADDQRVMHFMGKPQETKNLVVANHEAVLSPEWSIHSGCGTANYSFIWGMAGENKDYSDIDSVPTNTLL